MRKFLNFAALTVVAAAVSVSANATVISITNGSFENQMVNNSFDTLGTGSASLSGWDITGSIDHIGSYWQAADGNQSLDMNGSYLAGTISQIINVPTAGTVKVSFYMAGNPDNLPNVKTLGVTLGNQQTFTFDITSPITTSHANMGWVLKTASFNVASSGNYTLAFSALNDAGGAFGPALDNVTASVPDGGSTCVLLGMSLLGVGCPSPQAESGIIVFSR